MVPDVNAGRTFTLHKPVRNGGACVVQSLLPVKVDPINRSRHPLQTPAEISEGLLRAGTDPTPPCPLSRSSVVV